MRKNFVIPLFIFSGKNLGSKHSFVPRLSATLISTIFNLPCQLFSSPLQFLMSFFPKTQNFRDTPHFSFDYLPFLPLDYPPLYYRPTLRAYSETSSVLPFGLFKIQKTIENITSVTLPRGIYYGTALYPNPVMGKICNKNVVKKALGPWMNLSENAPCPW